MARTLWAVLTTLSATGAGGCIFVQKPPPNPYDRGSLPATAASGIILDVRGYQAEGLRSVWKESGRVYLLSEQTRIGPRGVTPFGNRPTDRLVTVQDVSDDAYRENWHNVNNFNLWWLPNWNVGSLMSEVTSRPPAITTCCCTGTSTARNGCTAAAIPRV